MGVDFFPCNKCDESICDCGDYCQCETCGVCWCSDECAKAEGAKADEDGRYQSCNYCTKKEVHDSELVIYLLKKLKLTRKKAVKQYFEERS